MAYKLLTLLANKANYGGTRLAGTIKYIVVHYTANKTDTAKANANYFVNNVVNASAHYFVDDNNVYQSVPDLNIAYSVGGSKYSDCATTGGGSMFGTVKNVNSISIEMCSRDGKFTEATLANAQALIKKLMAKYNIPAKNVYRHLDVNGKHCPGWDGWLGKDTSKWKAFKNGLSSTTTKTATTTTKTATNTATNTATTKTSTSSTTTTATVNAESGLKMRNLSGVVIYTIGYKKKVEVIKKSATTMTISGTKYTMAKVKWNGETGYVAQKYLLF